MGNSETVSKIQTLIESYRKAAQEGKLAEFSESDVGSKYILPTLSALGWDTQNIDEVKEQKRTLVGPVDYSLNVNRRPTVLVEIKRFAESLDGKRVIRGKEQTFPEQAVEYAWHLKVDWVVLTNFAETRLYYSHVRRPEQGLTFKLNCDDYLSHIDRLKLVSKEGVVSGRLDTLEKRRTRTDIDTEVLVDLFASRKMLVHSVSKNNPGLGKEAIREAVQKIIDRVLVIRVSEDRGVIGADSLWKELDSWRNRNLPTPFMRTLKSLFRDFDDVYNSKLFAAHPCEDLKLDNEVLQKVIDLLYKYNFDLISADVLGAIYEDYIGHVLEEAEKGVEIVPAFIMRKKAGIYYTPTHIVEYIVARTIGKRLEGLDAEQIPQLKIVDPACGSGSFLIKTFDILRDTYRKMDAQLEASTTIRGPETVLTAHLNRLTEIEKRIIRDNLFGVDLDPQAAEIAAVNLMLKALRRGERLPLILGENVKVGNSLLSGSEDLAKFFGEGWLEKNPFDWQKSFPEIFAHGGFDVAIGNPPHGAKLTDGDRRYFEAKYALGTGYKNSASLFIERTTSILKAGGILGFVIPKSLTYSEQWRPVRQFLLEKTAVLELADLSKAFPGVLLEQVVLICQTGKKTGSYLGSKFVWGRPVEGHEVPLEVSRDLDAFPTHLDETSLRIYNKIKAKSKVTFANVTDTFRGLPLQSRATETKMARALPVLRGDDLRPFIHSTPETYIPATAVDEDSEKIRRMRGPKIVSQRIVAHVLKPTDHIILMSALDEQGLLNFDTVENTVVTNPQYDIKYLVALLNSKLAAWYAYMFVFNKAVRTMDFDGYYVGKMPVYPADTAEQKTIAQLVDQMCVSMMKRMELTPDLFSLANQYPRLSDERLRENYWQDRLRKNQRNVAISSNLRGRIKRWHYEYADGWLVFSGDFETQSGEEFEHAEVARIKVGEELAAFLGEAVLGSRKNLGRGNVLDKLLRTPIPRFKGSIRENEETIERVARDFLRAAREAEKLDQAITRVETALNGQFYSQYDLTDEEIKHIEDSFGKESIFVDLVR